MPRLTSGRVTRPFRQTTLIWCLYRSRNEPWKKNLRAMKTYFWNQIKISRLVCDHLRGPLKAAKNCIGQGSLSWSQIKSIFTRSGVHLKISNKNQSKLPLKFCSKITLGVGANWLVSLFNELLLFILFQWIVFKILDSVAVTTLDKLTF